MREILRNWLITLLVGNKPVMFNLEIEGKLIVPSSNCLIKNNLFSNSEIIGK